MGVTGVMQSAQIMPLRWFGLNPQGECTGETADVVRAIDYARENGATVVNASWRGPFDQDLIDAIGRLDTAGILFVASAGNLQSDNDSTPHYPCSFTNSNIICVAAVDHNGNLANFSNVGVKSVDLGAPGVDILSTLTGGTEDYGLLSGTSMAAPFTTGVASLMRTVHTSYSSDQIKENLLLATQATPTGALDGKTHTGGMLNAWIAMLAFGDSFDDAADADGFFSDIEVTGTRWAVAQNGDARCDVFVDTVSGTNDRVAEVTFSGQAGVIGSTYTLATYEAGYPPGSNSPPHSVFLRVNTPDGSDFTGKEGRIGVGVLEKTGQTNDLFMFSHGRGLHGDHLWDILACRYRDECA